MPIQVTHADYIITRDDLNDVNDASTRRNGRLNNNVSTQNEDIEAERSKNSDWPDSAVYSKIAKNLCRICPKDEKAVQTLQDENLILKTMLMISQKRDDLIVPEISQNEDRKENLSPRGGKYNLRPNPNPNYSKNFRY